MQGKLLLTFVVVGALIVILFLMPLLQRTPLPFVVVMSGSMEPSLKPGDLLVIKGIKRKKPEIGDIVVYNSRKQGMLIVHRVVDIEDSKGNRVFFTKGDAMEFVEWERVEMLDVIGYVTWRIRYLGLPTYLVFKTMDRLGRTSSF